MSKYVAYASMDYTRHNINLINVSDEGGDNILISGSEVALSLALSSDAKQGLLTRPSGCDFIDIESKARIFSLSGSFLLACLSPDGTQIACMTSSRKIKLFGTSDGTILTEWKTSPHRSPYKSLSYGADGRQLLALSINGECSNYDTATGRRQAYIPGIPAITLCAASITSSHRIALGTTMGSVMVQELRDNPLSSAVVLFRTDLSRPIATIAIDDIGLRVAVGTVDTSVIILDAANGELLLNCSLSMYGLSSYIVSLAMNNEGTKFLARATNCRVALINCQSGEVLSFPATITGRITGLGFAGEEQEFLLK